MPLSKLWKQLDLETNTLHFLSRGLFEAHVPSVVASPTGPFGAGLRRRRVIHETFRLSIGASWTIQGRTREYLSDPFCLFGALRYQGLLIWTDLSQGIYCTSKIFKSRISAHPRSFLRQLSGVQLQHDEVQC